MASACLCNRARRLRYASSLAAIILMAPNNLESPGVYGHHSAQVKLLSKRQRFQLLRRRASWCVHFIPSPPLTCPPHPCIWYVPLCMIPPHLVAARATRWRVLLYDNICEVPPHIGIKKCLPSIPLISIFISCLCTLHVCLNRVLFLLNRHHMSAFF